MTASECLRAFDLHHKLLAVYEPHEALMWLVTPQKSLDMHMPCELLGDNVGFKRVVQLIVQVTESACT